MNDSYPLDNNKSQKCFLRVNSFLVSLVISGGRCDSLRVDHRIIDYVTALNVALNLSHSSSIDPSLLTDRSVEMTQSLIARILAHQIPVRGETVTYCILCIRNPK